MSVDSTTSRISFAGDGSDTTFPVSFYFQQKADLKVIRYVDTTGVGTPLVLNSGGATGFTISGTADPDFGYTDGGTVTTVTAPAVGTTLVIYRDPAIKQELEIPLTGPFPSRPIEKELDNLTLQMQRQAEMNSQSVRLSESLVPADYDLSLPFDLFDTPGAVVIVNDDGDGFITGPTADEIEGAQGFAIAAAASAAAALVSENNAETAKTNAETAETHAEAAQAAAETAQAAAEAAQAAAETAETNAETAETNAETAETNASASATAAAGSATTASTQATNASASATAAAGSATTASTQATNASASATAAAASAAQAAADAAAALYRWGGTSGGAADVQTLTPSTALGAYAAGVRFAFLAGFTTTSTTPTINVSGLGAKTLKDPAGSALAVGAIQSGTLYSISYDGSAFRVHELVTLSDASVTIKQLDTTTTSSPDSVLNLSLAASVAASAMTIAVKDIAGSGPSATSPVTVCFRNATSATGTYVRRQITAALSTVISSGSTAGHVSAKAENLYIYLLDNAGTVELAWSSTRFDDFSVQSTTAEGGAGAADSKTVIYSTTARSNVAVRLIGRMVSNQTTAGTWAAVPTEISVGARQRKQIRDSASVYTPNGYGSTNTKIRKYSGSPTTVGTAITVTQSSTNGDSFTINEDGLYGLCITELDATIGFSVNSNQLTTNITSITAANIVAVGSFPSLYFVRRFVVGDVIRHHSNGSSTGTAAYYGVEIVKLAD